MLSVRQVEPTDKPLLMAAAEADPYHKAAGLTGEHWVGRDSILYEDENGPVVALKTRNVVRVDVQFMTQDKARNAKALMEGFARYVQILLNRNVTEIVFNTNSPEVALFFQNRFRFREVSKGTYSLYIGK